MQRASESGSNAKPPSSPLEVSVVVDAVDCADARLTMETDKPNKLPLEFAISHFHLKGVRPGAPLDFDAQLQNPTPPGAIHSDRQLWPVGRRRPRQQLQSAATTPSITPICPSSKASPAS